MKDLKETIKSVSLWVSAILFIGTLWSWYSLNKQYTAPLHDWENGLTCKIVGYQVLDCVSTPIP